MKKSILSFVLSIVLAVTCSISALAVDYGSEYTQMPVPDLTQRFSDVPITHWAAKYINEMAQRDVISGYPDGRFIPENQVTRAEFAKIMVCAAGLRVENKNVTSFTDVYTSDWYCPYVECAKDYLTGYSTSTGTIYKPTTPALREDIAVALVKLKGYDISLADESILNMFTDSYSISSSARKYVAVAVERGIVSGYEDNTFRGQATITRAEAATLLWRAFQYGNDNKITDTGNAESNTGIQNSGNEVSTNETRVLTPTPAVSGGNGTVSSNDEQLSTPTVAPTPEPTEKPYKVDTLVKADVKDRCYYTYDSNNTIYYVEDNTVYSVDVNTGSKNTVLTVDELVIDNDEMTLEDFEIDNIFYNTNTSELFVSGEYKTAKTANNISNSYLYSVENGNIQVVTNEWNVSNIIGVLDNDALVPCNEFIQVGRTVYFWQPYFNTGYLIMQDIDNFESCGWYSGDEVFSSEVCAGFGKDYVMTATNDGNFTAYNFKGKELYTITSDDYEIKDANRNKLKLDNVLSLQITPNNSIIFYDKAAEAFRMISENN